jgi:hypothetical protein
MSPPGSGKNSPSWAPAVCRYIVSELMPPLANTYAMRSCFQYAWIVDVGTL